jgi:cytochrome P450
MPVPVATAVLFFVVDRSLRRLPTRLAEGNEYGAWVPFGGGTRRCVGAAFANMEMDVVLRTLLRNMTIQTTDKPGEKSHNRGVAYTPKRGARVVLHHRKHGEQPVLLAAQGFLGCAPR